ncbi:hypothetical protein ACVTMO_12200 [Pseudomonas segetis]
MKFRILFRVAKFIAYYWSIPFLLGTSFAFFLITQGEIIAVEQYVQAFDQVISSCEQ